MIMTRKPLEGRQKETYDFIVEFMNDEECQRKWARDKQYVPNRPPSYYEIVQGTDNPGGVTSILDKLEVGGYIRFTRTKGKRDPRSIEIMPDKESDTNDTER
jgi:hypothetical protein